MSYDFQQRLVKTTATGDEIRTAPTVCSSPKCGGKLWYYRRVTVGPAAGRTRVSCEKCKRFVGYVLPQAKVEEGQNLDGTIKKKRRRNSKETRYSSSELYT